MCVFIYREHLKAQPIVGSGEAGDGTCDSCFTRHNTYPLHQGGFKLHLIKYLLFFDLINSHVLISTQ